MKRKQRTTEILTAERLREVINYDPETGALTWKVDRGRKTKAGTAAGGFNAEGYKTVHILGRHYKVHRIAWFHFYGKLPELSIDHIDGNKSNNAIRNLRQATQAQNNNNRRCMSKYGIKGVWWVNGRWASKIDINGKRVFLGYFETPEDAGRAYAKAALDAHGEFANGATNAQRGQ